MPEASVGDRPSLHRSPASTTHLGAINSPRVLTPSVQQAPLNMEITLVRGSLQDSFQKYRDHLNGVARKVQLGCSRCWTSARTGTPSHSATWTTSTSTCLSIH